MTGKLSDSRGSRQCRNNTHFQRFINALSFGLALLILVAYVVGWISQITLDWGILLGVILLPGIFSVFLCRGFRFVIAYGEKILQKVRHFLLDMVMFAALLVAFMAAGILVSGFFRSRTFVFDAPAQFRQGVLGFYGLWVGLFIVLFFLFMAFRKSKLALFERFSRLYVMALSIVFLVFTLEILAGFYIERREFTWSGYVTQFPYADTFAPEGVDWPVFTQNAADFDISLVKDEATGLFLPANYASEYLNVENHFRVTTDQPETYDHTIYVFGGSTTFCLGSPDSFTLPSCLQRELLAYQGAVYRVENRGIIGFRTANQLAVLEHTALMPGDIVIFVDGINDSQRLFGSYFALSAFEKQTAVRKSISRLLSNFSERSAFYEFFLAPYNFEPGVVKDSEARQTIHRSIHTYALNAIMAAKDYTEASGATFIHFLQPNLFTISALSPRQEKLLHMYPNFPKGFQEVVEGGYEVLIDLEETYAELEIISFDITHVFEPEFRKTDQALFLVDWMHVAPEGNLILAEQIYLRITPYLE